MKTNIGSFDAGARFVLGMGSLFFSFHGLGWWGLCGLFPILTATIAYCPFYTLLHLNTAKWEEDFENRHRHHH